MADIVPITDTAGNRFAQAFAIFEASFPASERRTRAGLTGMMRRGDYKMVGLVEDGAVTGFATVHRLAGAGAAHLDYIATRADLRGGGRGSRLFKAAVDIADGQPLLVEVDSDREPSDDHDLRVRRKAFYARERCQVVAGLDYVLALPSEGVMPMMDLMVHPGRAGTEFSKTDVERWLRALFSQAYGQRPDDPRIGVMLAGMA